MITGVIRIANIIIVVIICIVIVCVFVISTIGKPPLASALVLKASLRGSLFVLGPELEISLF